MSDAVEKVKQAVKPQQHFKSITIVYHYSFIEYITQYLLSFKLSIQFTNHLFYL